MQCSKKQGGAGVVNLRTKDDSLKINWIKLVQTDTLIMQFMKNSLSPIMGDEIWKCNLSYKDADAIFPDNFWKDVLKSWAKINYKKLNECDSINDIKNQCIWYNTHLRLNKLPFLFSKPYKNGLIRIEQLCDPKGGFFDVVELCNNYKMSIMQCNSLLSSIPKIWKSKLGHEDTFKKEEFNVEKIRKKEKIAAFSYEVMNMRESAIKTAFQKWDGKVSYEIDNESFEQLFHNLYKVTNNIKLRSYQYRLLHSSIVTKQHLYRWKITQDNLCYFCKKEKETITHLMVECSEIQFIWQSIKTQCTEIASSEMCSINERTIMENLLNPVPDHIYNFFCLVTKQYIYATKCTGKKLSIAELSSRIDKYRRFELFQAKKDNKLTQHCKKWQIKNNTVNYNGTGLENEFINAYIYDM